MSFNQWQEANEALDIWCHKNKIKTRIQYYCGVCGNFVSKDTLNCKVCSEKSDLLVK